MVPASAVCNLRRCAQQQGLAEAAPDLQPAGDALAVLQDGAAAPKKPPPELQHLLPLVGRQLDGLQDVTVQLCRLHRKHMPFKGDSVAAMT